MKKILTDQKFTGWSISSISSYALKQNLLSACTATWYKYARILEIKRRRTLTRRKKLKTGIRAAQVNQIWHMDVTVFKTADNVKTYIHILMDNFSRYILGYRVSLSLQAIYTLELLREAYDNYIISGNNNETILITDGGPENYNGKVLEYTGSSDNSLNQLRALVDIDFSNSMVEAYNKILKYRFLYTKQIRDFYHRKEYLPKAIKDYNETRPHHAHRHQTPKEVFVGIDSPLELLQKRIEIARRKRIEEHRKSKCGVCD